MGVLSYSCLLHAVSASAELVDDDVITLVLENEYRKESMAAAEASLLSAVNGHLRIPLFWDCGQNLGL